MDKQPASKYPNRTVTPMPFKTIATKYVGPTDTEGSRIIASDEDGRRMSFSYRSDLGSDQNHAEACRQYADWREWSGNLVGGCVKGGAYVWVFVSW